jgi:hypothetical protein
MSGMRARLETIELPDSGLPGAMPVLPATIYRARLERTRERPAEHGYIVARRVFMRDAVRISLHADVLPFSNSPAYLAPFRLAPDRAMVRCPRPCNRLHGGRGSQPTRSPPGCAVDRRTPAVR